MLLNLTNKLGCSKNNSKNRNTSLLFMYLLRNNQIYDGDDHDNKRKKINNKKKLFSHNK